MKEQGQTNKIAWIVIAIIALASYFLGNKLQSLTHETQLLSQQDSTILLKPTALAAFSLMDNQGLS